MIHKTAAIGIKAKAVEELLKTEALRKSTIENIKNNSLTLGGINFLAKHGVPGAAGLGEIGTTLHSKVLKADTYLGALLRGNAKPGSIRYRLFTNSNGLVPSATNKNLLEKVDRASALKPINYTASAAVVPAAIIGLESLKDPEVETIQI